MDRDHDHCITTMGEICERLNMFSSISCPFLGLFLEKTPRFFEDLVMIKFSHIPLLPKTKEESEKGTSLSKLDMEVKNPLLFGFHLRFLGCTVSSP